MQQTPNSQNPSKMNEKMHVCTSRRLRPPIRHTDPKEKLSNVSASIEWQESSGALVRTWQMCSLLAQMLDWCSTTDAEVVSLLGGEEAVAGCVDAVAF